ncbi:hypothetical protein B0F90DRAFT_1671142 [Multifurca ochricompacta]|uniref:Uncharacterized protein n=1 Tax=Multifurca ochricompacta TaxID=376703 RepID=A0AAD4LVV5_9AGAM|nr:hypothetical protein B0F90DRAFT_1671142 [Multifurca ochricompacta]
MPRDVIDLSLIVNEPRKRKLASYATNEDNWSADKSETIKRMKKAVGLTDSLLTFDKADDPHPGATPCGSEGSSHQGSKSQKPCITNRGAMRIVKGKLKPKTLVSTAMTSEDDSTHLPVKDTDMEPPHVEEFGVESSEDDDEGVQIVEEDAEHELGK